MQPSKQSAGTTTDLSKFKDSDPVSPTKTLPSQASPTKVQVSDKAPSPTKLQSRSPTKVQFSEKEPESISPDRPRSDKLTRSTKIKWPGTKSSRAQ